MNRVRDYYTAPLGSITYGHLQFARGAANVTIHTDPSTDDLYLARFEGPPPSVRGEGGAVSVKYPWTLHPFDWRKRAADIVLNARVPWRIAVGGGGVSRLEADLSGPRLDSFEVEGGASRVELTLPEPSGTVPIRISGGANNLTIRRPQGVPARVHVGGGASRLALDDERFGAVGGETRLENPDYAGATDRYEIAITGGASDLTIGARASCSSEASDNATCDPTPVKSGRDGGAEGKTAAKVPAKGGVTGALGRTRT